jgi:type VI protein secretion system component Hcp
MLRYCPGAQWSAAEKRRKKQRQLSCHGRMRMKRIIGIFSLMFAGMLTMSSATAASSLYMKVPGITGAVEVRGYEGWIQVLSFSLGFSTGTCSSLTVTKFLDLTSPALTMAAVSGLFYPSVTLVSVKDGERPYEEFRLRLSNAAITSVQQSGSSDTPAESLSLQPSSVELTYYVQSDKGMAMPVSSTVDCQQVKVK